MNTLSDLSFASRAVDENAYRSDCRQATKLPEIRSLDLDDDKVISAPRTQDARGYF